MHTRALILSCFYCRYTSIVRHSTPPLISYHASSHPSTISTRYLVTSQPFAQHPPLLPSTHPKCYLATSPSDRGPLLPSNQPLCYLATQSPQNWLEAGWLHLAPLINNVSRYFSKFCTAKWNSCISYIFMISTRDALHFYCLYFSSRNQVPILEGTLL